MEFIYPTLGDDDDCVLVAATGPVEAMHPGYVGAEGLLDGPMSIAADALCLYHCLVAASDLSAYQSYTVQERSLRADALRRKSIQLLDAHGLSQRARRLELWLS